MPPMDDPDEGKSSRVHVNAGATDWKYRRNKQDGVFKMLFCNDVQFGASVFYIQ